jgi:hypothetical protein
VPAEFGHVDPAVNQQARLAGGAKLLQAVVAKLRLGGFGMLDGSDGL